MSYIYDNSYFNDSDKIESFNFKKNLKKVNKAVTKAVAGWRAQCLKDAIISANGCAAIVRR